MEKVELINLIKENIQIFDLKLPSDLGRLELQGIINNLDIDSIKIIAGLDKVFLSNVVEKIKIEKTKKIQTMLEKMEQIRKYSGPTGTLGYLGEPEVELLLSKLEGLEKKDITEEKIQLLIEEPFLKEIKKEQDKKLLDEQLTSAVFYLKRMGYDQEEIQKKVSKIKKDPSKVGDLFNTPAKEIKIFATRKVRREKQKEKKKEKISINRSVESEKNVQDRISRLKVRVSKVRGGEAIRILKEYEGLIDSKLFKRYRKACLGIHPIRLNRILAYVKKFNRKPYKVELLFEWLVLSYLLENIELKVEHWQKTKDATKAEDGVYKAGISFARYDSIIKGFKENRLAELVNASRDALLKPSKEKIQRIGRGLTAETGFRDRLYM